jgi:hypothetical protein
VNNLRVLGPKNLEINNIIPSSETTVSPLTTSKNLSQIQDCQFIEDNDVEVFAPSDLELLMDKARKSFKKKRTLSKKRLMKNRMYKKELKDYYSKKFDIERATKQDSSEFLFYI